MWSCVTWPTPDMRFFAFFPSWVSTYFLSVYHIQCYTYLWPVLSWVFIIKVHLGECRPTINCGHDDWRVNHVLRDMCYVTCMSGVLKNVCRANTHLEFILHKQYIDIVYNFVHFCRFVNCKLGNIGKKWVFLVKFE